MRVYWTQAPSRSAIKAVLTKEKIFIFPGIIFCPEEQYFICGTCINLRCVFTAGVIFLLQNIVFMTGNFFSQHWKRSSQKLKAVGLNDQVFKNVPFFSGSSKCSAHSLLNSNEMLPQYKIKDISCVKCVRMCLSYVTCGRGRGWQGIHPCVRTLVPPKPYQA